MKCEQVQILISSYLDQELGQKNADAVRAHLDICEECAKLHEDFGAILGLCEEAFSEDSAPPNPQALWCRINNIIETEVVPEMSAAGGKDSRRAERFSGLWNRSLQLSTSQVASAIVGIALVSSLLTVVGVMNFSAPSAELSGKPAEATLFEKVLAEVGVGETPRHRAERHISEQQAAINYWRKRVELRRSLWNADTKSVFDRNLLEIDKAVSEYTRILSENPQDSLSNEMLDSALKEKMALLREFSEL